MHISGLPASIKFLIGHGKKKYRTIMKIIGHIGHDTTIIFNTKKQANLKDNIVVKDPSLANFSVILRMQSSTVKQLIKHTENCKCNKIILQQFVRVIIINISTL